METLSDTSLKLTRVYDISIEEMWALWTDPAMIARWHRPNTVDYTTVVEADVRVGGAYRIAMTANDNEHTAFGRFTLVDKPFKLGYSWQWEGDPTNEISAVIVELTTVTRGTKLTLVHERLSSPESVKAHADGWTGCLVNINKLIEGDV
jgi:uncharacterized protein YndB with AHSA1/START domain